MSEAPFDFFHLIAHKECAEVRRFLTESGKTSVVSFRNIAYDTHAEALKALTGGNLEVPALIVSSARIITGAEGIKAFLVSTSA